MASQLYLIDASVLITANNNYYSIDRVPQFWEWLAAQGEQRKCKIPLEIFEEIKEGRKDEDKDLLLKWVKDRDVRDKLVLQEEPDPALADRAVKQGYAPDLTDDELIQIGRDPFLIAYALRDPSNRCVVTVETPKPKRQRAKIKLPDACDHVGVRWIDTFKFVQELDFRARA